MRTAHVRHWRSLSKQQSSSFTYASLDMRRPQMHSSLASERVIMAKFEHIQAPNLAIQDSPVKSFDYFPSGSIRLWRRSTYADITSSIGM